MLWAGLAALVALAGVALSPATATLPGAARSALPTWTPEPSQAAAMATPLLAATELDPTDSCGYAGRRGAPECAPGADCCAKVGPTQAPTVDAPEPTATLVVPPRLIIPALELDQEIVPVTIVDNNWDLNELGEDVGWLSTTGERPGDALAMTLVGHVILSPLHAGPFVDLDQLKAGDEVIYRRDRMDYRYQVQGTTMTQADDVSQLYLHDGTRLLLVTCSKWSYFEQHYTRRTIVTAQLMGLQPSP